jgi:hypothetical protein
MIVTITSIKLKSIWKFFALSYYALSISKQVVKQKGFLKFKKTGIGKLHYTLTAWETEEDMKAFAYQGGAHQESMKASAGLASELRTYSYSAEKLPDWKEAKSLLMEKGNVLRYYK